MKRIFIIGILVVFLAVSVQPAAAITGGELDGEDHPNVGLMIADIDGVPAWRCSGTLIAPRVFLTAGHCTGDGATGARVWFESDLTNNVDYPYPGPSAIEGTPIPHPLFATVATNYYDVGVVILDQPAAGVVGDRHRSRLRPHARRREGDREGGASRRRAPGSRAAGSPRTSRRPCR